MWVISVSRSRILLCVCVQFFADVLFYLEFTVLMRFRKYGLLNEFFTTYSQLLTVVPPISIGLHYYIKMVVYLGEISVAANRLTSAMRPVSYEKIWNPWFIWQVRSAQFIVPLTIMLPIVLNSQYEFKYVVYASQHTLRLETDPESTKVLALVDMVSSTSATIASLIMYISTVCRIRQLFRKQITNGNVQSNSNDCRLLLSALIMFLVYTPNTAMQVLTIAFKDKLSQVMFVNDLSYVLPPLLALLLWKYKNILNHQYPNDSKFRTMANK
ncbi:hypothetical protein NECAME_02436 [Necator americanus]|uniref:Serpentine receptor class gamma n=1 Tax=Necator americanus TaxID=51031 RepID=W2TFE6_NECAM|nr:hypothetical protein NECAME_02436 [Necator americanus]ETN80304.1 hypothetical protein NECAME_02436 [Necator americanus]